MKEPEAQSDGARPGRDDFPYYDGRPVALSGSRWWFLMALTALGFAALASPLLLVFADRSFYAGGAGQFIPPILYFVIPLVGLAIVAGRHWTAIFRRLRGRDFLWMVVFALLNMAVTLPVGWFVSSTRGVQANPALTGLSDMTATERILFFLKTAPSLFGEEVMTILPFLALMYLLYSRFGMPRVVAIIGAWLGSALLFGLAHLPTYSWDLVQCLVVIGSARLVLSLAYMKTKNIWVSTGAHILNDWAFFAFTILGAALTAG
jgi:membrane protease YdiL (CAAX protease family)